MGALARSDDAIVQDVDWDVGDEIVLASSNFDFLEAEKRTIVGAAWREITLDRPLEHHHHGGTGAETVGAFAAEGRAVARVEQEKRLVTALPEQPDVLVSEDEHGETEEQAGSRDEEQGGEAPKWQVFEGWFEAYQQAAANEKNASERE